MDDLIVEIKLELVISGDGNFDVKVKSIGGGVRKRVKHRADAVSHGNGSASFASTDGSYSYNEVPLSLTLVSLPFADDIKPNSGGETSGTEIVENPNR